MDKEEDRKELSRVIGTFDLGKSSSWGYGGSIASSERAENIPDRNVLLSLKFLDGQFKEVLEKGLNQSKALGWSGTFMKQGIAMFLLALHEGNWNGKGIRAMADMIKKAVGFSIEEYQYGLDESAVSVINSAGKEPFYDVIANWRQLTPVGQDMREKVIKKIEKLLEKRTAGIMEANRRNYYGECAAYIAALGEVKESLGEVGAKQSLMTSYKEKYPRRNAFRAEMKNSGWRG